MHDLDERLDTVLDVPWELVEYERWCLAQTTSAEDYLFARAKPRFSPDDEDLLRPAADLTVIDGQRGLELSSAQLGSLPVSGVKRAALERVLRLIDGRRTLAELRARSGADRPALERLLETALGSLLFVPESVARLEAAVSGVELVRFVGAPYEIVRAYWANSAALRGLVEARAAAFRDAKTALRQLRQLHVVLLLGPELDSFYRPASRIAARGVRPGALYATASKRARLDASSLLLAGPRVGVAPVGGLEYHRALALAAGDPLALEPERHLEDADGLAWGDVVTGRALDEAADAAWFCPPRPLEPEHFEKLFAAFRAALDATAASDAAAAVDALARFHFRFVRLHPFRAGNQSLAMNLVNWALRRVHGAGMPHLLLDQLALRFGEAAYVRVFRLAVEGHVVTGSAESRWSTLAARKRRVYDLIQRLQRERGDAAVEAALGEDAEASRWALIAR